MPCSDAHRRQLLLRQRISPLKPHVLFLEKGVNAVAKALVFINTKLGAVGVIRDLEKVQGVSEAHSSRGMYDAVALVQGETLNEVKETISNSIRIMESVKSTLTLTLIEELLKKSG
jgi:DNA-binding Lrp family transcriptional regulator